MFKKENNARLLWIKHKIIHHYNKCTRRNAKGNSLVYREIILYQKPGLQEGMKLLEIVTISVNTSYLI